MAHVPTARLQAALVATALVVGPALLAVGWLLQPTPDGTGRERLLGVAASVDRWRLSWVLLVLGGMLLVPVGIALARPIVEASQVGALSGKILTGLGGIMLVGVAASRGLLVGELASGASDPALLPGAAFALDNAFSGVLRPFAYTGEVIAVGLIILGVCLAWRGPAPRWGGAAIALGGAVIFGSQLVSQPLPSGVGALIVLAGTLALVTRIAPGR